MPSQTVRLEFPPRLQDEPVINRLLRRYSFTVNILRANVKEDKGWMDIHISGKAAEMEDASDWLRKQGVEVILLSQ